MQYWSFAKISHLTFRRIVNQISNILTRLKKEYNLKEVKLWSSNLMLHLPTSPDHLSMQENWQNSYFSDHLQIVITELRIANKSEK